MEEDSELLRLRREKLQAWRTRGIDPFGQQFADTQSNARIVADYQEEKSVRAAGRLISLRPMGKAVFAHILDSTGKLQIYAQKEALGENFDDWKLLDLGDFIGVEGTLFMTKTGEKTIRVTHQCILSKALRPIPTQWYGLADVEARYRQRYLDMIVNDDARNIMMQRSRIVWEMRRFLEQKDFLEVETPMMQTIAGGAAAKPFVTHHNALDIPLYLRIAPELFLKRLLVGGFEKIFELNRNFRNEGLSRRHNPEFTMLEIYWAYENFESMAHLMESMSCAVAQNVLGSLKIPAIPATEASPGRPALDLTPPWPRQRYKDLVREVAGADWFDLTPEARRAKAEAWAVHLSPAMADHEVTHQVFEKMVESKIMNPVFVTHVPKHLIPLAKQNAEDPDVIDVFDLIIAGQEVGTGYSELNDPIVQRNRLVEQIGDEVQMLDEDFLTALEYGMPPAGGIGFGIDRFVMTLTGAESIRDVILFPLLKPKM